MHIWFCVNVKPAQFGLPTRCLKGSDQPRKAQNTSFSARNKEWVHIGIAAQLGRRKHATEFTPAGGGRLGLHMSQCDGYEGLNYLLKPYIARVLEQGVTVFVDVFVDFKISDGF